MSIEHADFDGIERLALVLGGEIASTFDNAKDVKLGHCKQIAEIMIGEDKLIHFSGEEGVRVRVRARVCMRAYTDRVSQWKQLAPQGASGCACACVRVRMLSVDTRQAVSCLRQADALRGLCSCHNSTCCNLLCTQVSRWVRHARLCCGGPAATSLRRPTGPCMMLSACSAKR